MRGRTSTIGVLVPDIDNPAIGLVVQGLRAALAPRNYDPMLLPAGSEVSAQEAATHALIDHRVDGLLLVAPRTSDDFLERIGRDVPTVVAGRHGPGQYFDTVAGDDAQGSELVVDHLARLGHRRILYVDNAQTTTDEKLPERVRGEAFLSSMRVRGMATGAVVAEADWSINGGRDLGKRLLDGEFDITAIHAGADVVALGILEELWRAGVAVPDRLSIVGYDNSPTAALLPISLTSVEQGGIRTGEAAGEMLLERLAGRETPRAELIEPRLVLRGTTAPPPDS
jgi:LacI family transcriptional regulator